MWCLCKSAYEQYKCEIINGNKLYHRFVNGLLYSNQVIDSKNPEDWKRHVENLLTLQELLTDRRDLVERYFQKPSFALADYEQMMNEFNTVDSDVRSQPSVLGHFNEAQFIRITQFVNEKHKDERLFHKIVTVEEIKGLFCCNLKQPLRAGNNSKLALFLNYFLEEGLITWKWQKLIEQHHLLLSSVNARELTSKAISVYLTKAKQRQSGKYRPFLSLVKELAEM